MKPLTRWHGSKVLMVNHVLPMIPVHMEYIEPFCGGAAVFFAKQLARVNVLNDRMDLLVNMYRQIQLHPEEFMKRLKAVSYSRSEYKRTAQLVKSDNPDPMEVAVAFWYQCNSSFLNKPGAGWITRKSHKDTHLYDISTYQRYVEHVQTTIEMLKKTYIENMDAIDCIKKFDQPTAFFYVDPPYVGTTMGPYGTYTESDYEKLLDTLSGIQGKFLLSSFDSDLLQTQVNRHSWHQKHVKQDSGAKNGGNGKGYTKTEVLTCNYNPNPELF